MMEKRKRLWLALLLGLVLTMSGCAGGEKSNTSPETAGMSGTEAAGTSGTGAE